jgi:uncharacterized membrane protein YgcG
MRVLLTALVLLVLSAAAPATAFEMIRSYVQRVEVGRDDRLAVTETITVDAEGSRIRRGIYRDFPTVFEDANGVRRQVGFSVLGVTRDGAEEPWRTERMGDTVRIWIGDADVFLSPGRYRYEIRYETTRQLRRFDDHDELFWNVTGNEWEFVIGQVEATVVLPTDVRIDRAYAYTGLYGDRGSDYRMDMGADGRSVTFTTTRMLQPREGLSVVVEMPAGTVLPPDRLDSLRNLWLDNQSAIIAGGGLAAVLLYYLVAWWRVGRDPERGTVIPLFEAPDGISAPLAQYIHERGLTNNGFTAMSAAWIALAVRGLVKLDGADKDLSIRRTAQAAPADLPRSERALLDWLDRRGGFAVINKHIGPAIQKLAGDFRAAVMAEKRAPYFHLNAAWLVLGVFASVATVVAVGVLSATGGQDIGSIVPMLFGLVFGGVVLGASGRLWKRRGILVRIAAVVAGITGVAMLALTAWAVVPVARSAGTSPWFLAAMAGLVVTNGVFFALLPAATSVGRRIMDGIEGLILYMTVAEEKRLNMAGMPPVTPSRYETLLPYAVALGVEQPWTEALDSHLARAAATEADYSPAWYTGRWDRHDHRAFASGLGAMAGSFQSSVPAPKSSSSGRSGGSGGGGGGGGGGGW